tara:strand:- start:4043 stop:4597 length:555 start_codon:yes stop_codon:yes gene_type:complete
LKSNSAPHPANGSDLKVIRVRESRPALSTIASSGSVANELDTSAFYAQDTSDENTLPSQSDSTHHRRDFTYTSTTTDSTLYLMRHRAPLSSSDVSSLNCLQDLVSPRDLLKSRFVSAPLVEAKIRLPPEDNEEARKLQQKQSWVEGGFGMQRSWTENDEMSTRVPFDSAGAKKRDPRLRWSVDF